MSKLSRAGVARLAPSFEIVEPFHDAVDLTRVVQHFMA
jgi:hypothetical protein